MQPTNCTSKGSKSPSAGSRRDCFQKSSSMYKESTSSSTTTTSSIGLSVCALSCDEADQRHNDEDEALSPSLTSSPDLLTSSSACSSMQSSQSTSPLPPLSPCAPPPTSPSPILPSSSPITSTAMTVTSSTSTSSTSTSTGTTTTVTAVGTTTKRRYRLAKKRTMPPRSNSTPLPPESDNVAKAECTSPNSASSNLTSSRSGRFGYSESLQRRLISSFLRQNSAEDVTTSGKKKSGKGDADTISVSATDEIKSSQVKSTKALSLSNLKSSSVPSIVKRADSKEGKDTAKEDAGPESGARRNTGDNYSAIGRARPKLSSLANEPSMRSTISGGISSSPPSSIPAIVVVCPDGGDTGTSGQPSDEDLGKTIQGEIKIQAENGETRVLRSAPDWTESAINADHLWVSTSTSGSDLCYVGERECSKTGPRLCCPACKVTAHTGCISTLIDKLKIHCKPTFKDGVRQYREQPFVKHHWVHRRHEKGRCKACGKSFQSKLSFGGNKEIVAISCSWCKAAFHNKSQCYTEQLLAEPCDFGNYAQIIVPPTWIVKLPRKGSFKSSIRRAPRNKRLSSKRRSKKQEQSAVNPVVPGANVTLSVGSPLASSGDKLNCSGSSTASSTTIASLGSSCSGSPSSVILSLQQAQSENVAETPSPFLGQHNGALHHSHPAHFAHSPHYYSKHNQPESMYANSTTSGPGRRQYRRHSHAAVSASSLTSGLLSAESKDGQLSYPHPTTTSHFLHTVHRSFAIKPIPSANLKPLLVFINPKSGGNQGAKLMQKFQWHLNPRQVFDLSQGGPRLGLDLYKKVHNLRVLACGGDGTAGWVLSTIDEIGIQPPPPIAVLPLGTGNDLARSINWGGSYTDEPVSKILCNIQDGEVVQLDRWNLKVQRNVNVPGHILIEESKGQAKPELPLNVVNNYFSIGVDAHIALSFHEAREAHPERFNSRLRNRMFYGQAGGKDLMQRKWKDLSHYVTLECDGVDYTWRLKELKVHSVLFLNIPSYSGGTRPWAQSSSYEPQSTNDGKIEVIGLTTYQLPLLQAGGHGTCIAQCQSAKIITTRTIPMQVDGEPCRLLPSLIHLELRNKANLIAKTKSIIQHRQMPTLEKITLKVRKLNLVDYETYHYDKDRLKDLSTLLGAITIEQNLELIHVRTRINDLMKEKGLFVVGASDCTSSQTLASLAAQVDPNASPSKISPTNISLPSTSFSSPAFVSSSSVSNKFVSNDWCFVDSCTAERFFRIDRAQEHLHYVVDICNEDLYILDPQFEEKDEIDLLTSEEVIADFGGNGGSSAGDETDQGNASSMLADSDQQSDIPSVDSLPSRFPNEMPSLLQLNGSTTANYSSTAPKSGEVSKLSLPGLSADGTQQAGSSQLSDLDASPNSLAVTPELGSKFPNHNGSLGLSPLSPQPYSIDSPPRSPRRGQKMPQSYLLQDQLISAAQTGDVSLLKQLHHKGVNLMKADENRMTALHHAAINGHENAVSFLLNAFTPDMLDLADRASGHTALHCAVLAGHRNICTMLAIRGATLSVKDHQGRSAQDLAHYLGQHDLAAALSHLSSANNRETTV